MTSDPGISRRSFLKVTAAAGGAVLFGFSLPSQGRVTASSPAKETPVFKPNAWIRVSSNDEIVFLIDKSEMGQGVMTALPMLIAEEMEVDLNKVRIGPAPVGKAYVDPLLGLQATGGSTSVRGAWERLRQAGAIAREMFLAAAAKKWGVAPETCIAENGTVLHKGTGSRFRYGELVGLVVDMPVPTEAFLKDPKHFRYIGKPVPRVDTPAKVDGSAIFGIDVRVPGMLIAVVERSPVFGGKVRSYDASEALKSPGVKKVIQIDSGIAVLADHFWAAQQGRNKLKLVWNEGSLSGLNSADLRKQFAKVAGKPGVVASQRGDTEKALQASVRKVEAVYEVPYLAHATMEPMNCTAYVQEGSCEVWAPTQSQGFVQTTAATITGLKPEQIRVNTTFLGGGFGRRFEQDFVAEAVQLSKQAGVPVKVVWTREDDTRHDYYRPATYNRLIAGLNDRGLPVSWSHRIVGPSIMSRVFPDMVKNGLDNTSVEGAANLPYDFPNLKVEYAREDPGVPVGFWRSVGSSQNAFVTESFLDELAVLGGQDPYTYRRRLLSNAPRHRAVLERAATEAGWGEKLPKGRGRGIAVHESFGSYVAEVADVSVSPKGEVRVDRIVCVVDCGTVVNPDTVRAQMESAIVFGLSAALTGEITLKNGRVVQGNFNDYPVLRMDQMPKVIVHILPSQEPPGGVGEPGTPPVAPAVVNAIFAATGKRIRRLPISGTDLRTA